MNCDLRIIFGISNQNNMTHAFDFLNDGSTPMLQIYVNNEFFRSGYLIGWNGREYIFDSRNGSFALPSDLTDYSFAMTNPHTM